MPIHDWTRVEAGIFHHFHHAWIGAISGALNAGRLPDDYYALAEQHAAGFGPDVLTLQGSGDNGHAGNDPEAVPSTGGVGVLLAPPKIQLAAEAEVDFYRRKQSSVAIRHVSGDRIVAMVEVVSPGNKSNRHGLRSFIEKAAFLFERGVHLLVLDLHPPGPRDPHGLHAALWEYLTDQPFVPPAGKPLTMASYETGLTFRAYLQSVAVGDALEEMPLFLEPGAHIAVPLEETYTAAFAAVPRRWRRVLERPEAS